MTIDPPLRKIFGAVAILWAFSLLVSWPVASLLGNALQGYAGESLWLERLSGGIDPLFLSDFLPNAGPALSAIPVAFLPVAVFYFLVQILFSGGLMKLFCHEGEKVFEPFARGMVTLGFRYCLLWVLFLPVFALGVVLVLLPFVLAGDLFPENPSELFTLRLYSLQAVLVFLAVSFLHSVQYLVRAVMANHTGRIGWSLKRTLRVGFPLVLKGWAFVVLVTALGGVGALFFSWLGVLCYGSRFFLWVFLQGAVFCLVLARVWLHRFLADLVKRNVF